MILEGDQGRREAPESHLSTDIATARNTQPTVDTHASTSTTTLVKSDLPMEVLELDIPFTVVQMQACTSYIPHST